MYRHNPLLLTLFFFSGATALVYQVIWTRLLTLAFGSTTLAVSTVLTAFMGGLAIGSAVLGRKADTAANPVRFYGWLELLIGLFAFATPLVFAGIEKLFVAAHVALAPGFWESVLLRFALSLILLLPPTILMGGTLPMLSKYYLRQQGERTGMALSVLYFINTIGAVVGTLLAGLFLVQTLGIERLLWACGLVNVAIFIVAVRMRMPATETSRDDSHGLVTPVRSRWSPAAMLAVGALFFSGLAALVYEVVWTRVLTLVIGSSTYAFTVMLATFLAGIALGSLLIGKFADRKNPLALLAFCQVMIGVCAIGTAAVFGLLPGAFVTLFGVTGDSFVLFVTANFLLCFLVMVPATLFMGASFPVAGAMVVEAFGSSGKRIGYLYAGNTIGAIIGAFLAGFVLLPAIGIHGTLVNTALLNLVVALVLATAALRWRGSVPVVALAVGAALSIGVLLFAWQPPWDTKTMMSGPYVYARQYQQQAIGQRFATIDQPFYEEGPIATVTILQQGEQTRLVVDGKTDAGNLRDMATQVLLGHLPNLLKPNATDVLIIGFASGITAGAVARHEVHSIDNVEIEPAMEAASEYFRRENYGVLDDERLRLIIDDARAYELTTQKKYDLVISEPSNPWQAGSSRLFTREAFENARALLREDGLMVQWMHLYSTSPESLRLVARTFASVFEHVTLWMDPTYSDVIFIGSRQALAVDPLQLARQFSDQPRVRESLARIGYRDARDVVRAYVLGDAEFRAFAGAGGINTDNLPHLEFRAPKSLYSLTALADNKQALEAARLSESFPAVRHAPEDGEAVAAVLDDWAVFLARNNDIAGARGALLRATGVSPGNAAGFTRLGYLRMASGDGAGASDAYRRALAIDPGLASAHANLGTLYAQAGDDRQALTHLEQAVALGEGTANVHNNLAVIHARQGRFAEAFREAELAVRSDPDDKVAAANLVKFRQLLISKRKPGTE